MTEAAAPDRWIAAEDAADLHRYQRLHPTTRFLFAERWLRPLVGVLLVLDIAALLGALWLPDDLSATVGSAAIAGILLDAVVAFVWGYQTNRLSMAGPPNIRSALPPGIWPGIRQQIFGDHVLDSEHADTITEIAHQQRAQQQGQLALLTYMVPMYLYLGTRHDPLGPVFLIAGTLGLGAAVVSAINTNRHLTRFINRIERS